jgi:hypothetical protein
MQGWGVAACFFAASAATFHCVWLKALCFCWSQGATSYWLAMHSNQANLTVGGLWHLFMWLQALKLHSAFGLPAGLNLAALKAWWARASRTSEAHYFLLAVAGEVLWGKRGGGYKGGRILLAAHTQQSSEVAGEASCNWRLAVGHGTTAYSY